MVVVVVHPVLINLGSNEQNGQTAMIMMIVPSMIMLKVTKIVKRGF